jgi:hypothetical protein
MYPDFADDSLAALITEACLVIRQRKPNSIFVKPEYRDPDSPLEGCCYHATEAYYHLTAGDYLDAGFLGRWEATGRTVMRGDDGPHWWIQTPEGGVIELLRHCEYPDDIYPGYDYDAGKPMSLRKDGGPHKKPFQTRYPSKRARWVISLVVPSHPHAERPW